jgi:hypothetical protein
VNAAWDEFVGLLEAMKTLGKENNGAKAIGIVKKIDNIEFVGTLCLLKNMLPISTTLSKTFQINPLNFSRLTPAILKAKEKIREVANDRRVVTQLRDALENCFKGLI